MYFRAFALSYGLEIETPLWIGKYLFGLKEPEISEKPKVVVLDGVTRIRKEGFLQMFCHDIITERAAYLFEKGKHPIILSEGDTEYPSEYLPFDTAEMDGLFLAHTSQMASHRKILLESLTPIPEISHELRGCLSTLRSLGRTIVGLHIRRGDFVGSLTRQGFELLIPLNRYRKWLRELWKTLEMPALLISSDEDLTEEFAEFSPVTAQSLGATVPSKYDALPLSDYQCQLDAKFFPDWYLLTMSDVLIISNSTFSFSAALLNRSARHFYRPTFEGDFVPFDPWNSEPLLFIRSGQCLPVELLRRAVLDSRAAGWSRFPKTLTSGAKAYWFLVKLRSRYAFHKGGWREFLKTVIDPNLYLATRYRIN
jgi:hypothetical protein